MSKRNKWELPSGALERHFGPICSLAPDGSAHFRSFDTVDDFKKSASAIESYAVLNIRIY